MSKRSLTGEERALWRRVARTVRVRRTLPEEPEKVAEPATPRKRAGAATTPVAKKATAKVAPQAKAVADRGGEKKVRRGQVEISMRLDLHGHTQDQAQAALRRFLTDAQARGERVVLVITGKGRDGGEGVLKRRLTDWLSARPIRQMVAGRAEAHARHGGSGAVYVFLKRPE